MDFLLSTSNKAVYGAFRNYLEIGLMTLKNKRMQTRSFLLGSVNIRMYPPMQTASFAWAFYHSESGKIPIQVDEELNGQIHAEMIKDLEA